MAVQRTAIDPVEWGLGFHMHQGEVVSGAERVLRCSGQVALTEDPDAPFGLGVIAPGEVRPQLEAALLSVDELLRQAGMQRSDIVFVHFYTTDVAAFLEAYEVYAAWIEPAKIMPPQTLLGVNELAVPGLTIEVEVTAAQ